MKSIKITQSAADALEEIQALRRERKGYKTKKIDLLSEAIDWLFNEEYKANKYLAKHAVDGVSYSFALQGVDHSRAPGYDNGTPILTIENIRSAEVVTGSTLEILLDHDYIPVVVDGRFDEAGAAELVARLDDDAPARPLTPGEAREFKLWHCLEAVAAHFIRQREIVDAAQAARSVNV